MDLKEKLCLDCGTKISYNEKYDTHYCETCNKWLEERCGDEECEFCSSRPDSPKLKEENVN